VRQRRLEQHLGCERVDHAHLADGVVDDPADRS
jgi:hypothetical protein